MCRTVRRYRGYLDRQGRSRCRKEKDEGASLAYYALVERYRMARRYLRIRTFAPTQSCASRLDGFHLRRSRQCYRTARLRKHLEIPHRQFPFGVYYHLDGFAFVVFDGKDYLDEARGRLRGAVVFILAGDSLAGVRDTVGFLPFLV